MGVYVKLVLTAVFWGGTFVAGRIIAAGAGPFSAACLRFVFASLFLVILTRRLEGRLPRLDRGQIVPAVLLGMTGVFAYNVLFFSGLKTVTASRASLIIATNPVFISLCSAVFFRERLDGRKILGILLSVSGAAMVISRGAPWEILRGASGWGELAIFGCVLSWVVYSLVGKKIMKGLAPMAAVTYSCLIGAAALILPAYVEGIFGQMGGYAFPVWLAIIYLALFGSALGFSWYYQGIQAIGPSRAAVFINLVPVSAVLLAWLLLNETIQLSLVVGAVLVTGGVYLTNSGSRREEARWHGQGRLHGMTMADSALVFITEKYNRNSIAALCGALEGDERFPALPVSFADTRGAVARLKGLLGQYSQVVAGFSFCTPNLMEIARILGTLHGCLTRAEAARLRLVAGGPHPSGDPEGTLALGFECVVVGEGEKTVPELLGRMVSGSRYGDVPGVAYLEAGAARHTGRGAPVDLDRVPPFSVAYRRFGPVEITRGCPWTCRYCQTPRLFGSVWRHRSVEAIARHAEAAKTKGLRDLRFVTPDALSYGAQGKEPDLVELERLLKAVVAIYGKDHVYLGSFPSEVRPDTVTEEAVKLIKAHVANDNLVIGAQSGSQRVLDLMGRGHSVEDVYRAVALITRAGLLANVDVILGLPGEMAEDVKRTLKMMVDLTSIGARVHTHTFIPLAGTPLADAPPGRVDGETRRALGRLAGQGRQFGSWQRQERLGRELAAFRARRR